MPPDRRHSPLLDRSLYAPRTKEIRRAKAHKIFCRWVAGDSYEKLSSQFKVSVDDVRYTLRYHVRELYSVYAKRRLAEIRCHALAMELRLLRMQKDAPPDQSIEVLNPPKIWLQAFYKAGIYTVYQLRCVDSDTLLAHKRFPCGAIDWACMKFEKLGLSHALRRPEVVRIVTLGRRIER